VSIDLTGPAYRCSCPSRKFPCKHALALLLLWVRSDGAVTDAAEPAGFAGDWAAQRAQRRAHDAARAARKPPDPEARARRAEQRIETMSAGIEDFAQWLADLVRSGTAAARRQPWSWWDATAARLVDAQLPGLAERVRDMSSAVNSREDWADHLLAEVGRWWTAVHAWRHWRTLDEATRGDLKAYVGWATPSEDIRTGDPEATTPDHWQVLGVHRSDDGRLQQQRTWLRSIGSGEVVQVLDFTVSGGPPLVAQLVGSVLEAPVARYPGSRPQRALFAEPPVPVRQDADLPTGGTVGDALGELADVWARNPWAGRAPVVVHGAIAPPRDGHPSLVVDATGAALPLLVEEPWELLARTGGHPTEVFGELESAGFRPLTVEDAS
jgi:hypothetical protein